MSAYSDTKSSQFETDLEALLDEQDRDIYETLRRYGSWPHLIGKASYLASRARGWNHRTALVVAHTRAELEAQRETQTQ